jgi:trigger factor
MEIVRENKDPLNAVIKVRIERDDYESKYNDQLKNYRGKAHLKGFRKGKTPMEVIRKMYGKAVLIDVVNEVLEQEMQKYLTDNNIKILGQPLPSKEHPPQNFETRNLGDFEFKFDIGLSPEFDLEGLSKSEKFQLNLIKITEKMIDKQLDHAKLRMGKEENPEQDILADDIITLQVRELENEAIKEIGHESTFKIDVKAIADKVKNEILKKRKGDKIRINIFKLEDDRSIDYVRKYYLKLADDDKKTVGESFEATIIEVSRVIPAELNQAFFDNFFGTGNVSSVDEAREKIKSSIDQSFRRQGEAILYAEFQKRLMEKNKLSLPDDFLQRWLQSGENELTLEQVKEQYSSFAENLQWTLIENRIKKDFSLKVEEEELRDHFKQRIQEYMRGYPMSEDMLKSSTDRLMQDKEQLQRAYDEIMSDKIFDTIHKSVSIKEKRLDEDKFRKKLEEAEKNRSKG